RMTSAPRSRSPLGGGPPARTWSRLESGPPRPAITTPHRSGQVAAPFRPGVDVSLRAGPIHLDRPAKHGVLNVGSTSPLNSEQHSRIDGMIGTTRWRPCDAKRFDQRRRPAPGGRRHLHGDPVVVVAGIPGTAPCTLGGL